MADRHFIQLFRLDKQSVSNIIQIIKMHCPVENNNAVPIVTKVLVTLHFLGVGSFQNSVGVNSWLSVSQATVSRSIKMVCSLMVEHMLKVWVKFPTTNEEIAEVKREFYRKYQFRGVLGVIDGTHIEILAPPETDENYPPFVYINRKGKYSINVMLISDCNSKILACNARFPGSVHDSAVWQSSSIRQYLQRQYEQGDRNSHLIGDSGYPLEPWLFTPFLNARNNQEEHFNQILCNARNVIERTNGILKGRFRCLSRLRTLMYHPVQAANIIYTCCILHNIMNNRDLLEADIELPEGNEPIIALEEADYGNIFQLGTEARALYIRNNL